MRSSAETTRVPYAKGLAIALSGTVGFVMSGTEVGALVYSALTFATLHVVERARKGEVLTLLSQYNKLVAPHDGIGNPAFGLSDILPRLDSLANRLSETATRIPRRHPVTNLPTRELLLAVMDDDIDSETATGLLGIIDILDFDRLCAFDQEAADRLLKVLAGKLVRMSDPRRTIAQIDRSRFAIWFSGIDTEAAHIELKSLCYALRDRLDEAAGVLQPQIRSASASARSGDERPSEIVARAVAALSTPLSTDTTEADPRELARRTYWLEQQLRRAIERQEFELFYQPFVDASLGRICGAEALLRWHNIEAANPSPDIFIPIAERIGLAEDIGLWTLSTACRQAREWERMGHPGLKVAVNMSAHQLERPDLDALIRRTVDQQGLKPALLEIELTETVAAIDSVQAKALLQRIREIGIAVSIDDFGAGYSSLSYLKQLVFDKLKIDREFVTDVHRHKDSQAICQSIIALGRGLSIPVLAEGVETREEYLWLRRHGCDFFQGFYFSRPLPVTDFLALVTQPQIISRLTETGPASQLAGLTARHA